MTSQATHYLYWRFAHTREQIETMSNWIIGVDIGGTQMRAARFNADLELVERVANPTLADTEPDTIFDRFLDTIESVMPEDRSTVAGIGVSVPGPVNPHEGTVIAPPNLPRNWHNLPVRKRIQEHFDCITYLGNDANVAALAEATRGAAKGYRYVIYLTVSTGIGSGIIDDGHLLVGAQGLGAEAGHMMMIVDGQVMDWEAAASGTAIGRDARQRLRDGAESHIREMVDGNIDRVTSKTVGMAAAEGDPLGVELIERAGRIVGLGIVSLMHIFNPQIIVVGGGVTNTGDLLFDPMRAAIREHTLDPAYHERVPVVKAALGDSVALIGAAALVMTRGGSQV